MLRLPPVEPEETYPVQEYMMTLGDVTVTLVYRYCERTDGWYLDVYDSAGDPLLTGKRLAADWPVTARYQIDGLPEGWIALLDTAAGDVELGEDDLGRRGEMVYLEPDDIPEVLPVEEVTIL